MFKIFVDGEAGTTGLQIFERLAKRNDLEILKINPELRKDVNERQKMINESDVTFLCLPDAASMESAALCTNPNTRIIDASTAHRVNPAWTYGMPELSAAQRIASQVDMFVLAQGSMARMEQRLAELTGKPVLSSPVHGVKGLRKFLGI